MNYGKFQGLTLHGIISLYEKHGLKPGTGCNLDRATGTACLNGILGLEAGAQPSRDNGELYNKRIAQAITGNEDVVATEIGLYAVQVGFDYSYRPFAGEKPDPDLYANIPEKRKLYEEAWALGRGLWHHYNPKPTEG